MPHNAQAGHLSPGPDAKCQALLSGSVKQAWQNALHKQMHTTTGIGNTNWMSHLPVPSLAGAVTHCRMARSARLLQRLQQLLQYRTAIIGNCWAMRAPRCAHMGDASCIIWHMRPFTDGTLHSAQLIIYAQKAQSVSCVYIRKPQSVKCHSVWHRSWWPGPGQFN